MNIDALSAKFYETEVALISSEENCFYFSEFFTSNGYLIIGHGEAVLLTDERYIEAASKEAKDCTVELLKTGADFYDQVREIVADFGGATILCEASRLSVADGFKYRDNFLEYEIDVSSKLDNFIAEVRAVKAPKEIEKMKKAQQIAEMAFAETLPFIKPGVIEREIAIELDYRMRKHGADGSAFDTIAITGQNTSKPHGVPGDFAINSGDFFTLDFGAIYQGYCSDTTRTIAIGTITDEQKHVYDTVLKAQLAGVEAVRAGVSAKGVDAVCRDIIKCEGYGDYFTHSTGHGVGVEIHESPTLSTRTSEHTLLVPGNVVTIEPGIYLPGKFGVRIEDMLMVMEDGAYNFCSLPKELISL